MKTLCLENYGVSPMETQEMKATDGGFPWLFMPTTEGFRELYFGC
jgi:hypothetical protein